MKDFVTGKNPHAFPMTTNTRKGNLNDLFTESHLSCSNINQVKAKRFDKNENNSNSLLGDS